MIEKISNAVKAYAKWAEENKREAIAWSLLLIAVIALIAK